MTLRTIASFAMALSITIPALIGCPATLLVGSSGKALPDAAAGGGDDAGHDGGLDTGSDAGPDAGPNGGPDGGCLDAGGVCRSYSDCCSQACIVGVCAASPCADAGTGCGGDSDCCSGNCARNVCDPHLKSPSCGPLAASCASEASCCDGFHCSDAGACCVAGSSNVTCAQDADCCWGHCDGGVCCSAGNELCAVDADCCAGLGCNFGVCVAACRDDGGCGPHNDCVDGLCRISTGWGWCLRDPDCVTQKCYGGRCLCGLLNNPCITNNDCCGSGTQCASGVCKIASGQGYCIQDADCVSQICSLPLHRCLGRPGDFCGPDGDSDCASGHCNPPGSAGSGVDAGPGVCQ